MSQQNKPLSIIFCCWNKKPYLKKSLRNTMGQVDLGGGDEVIVADGGSTDGVEKMLRHLYMPDVQFVTIPHTPYNLQSVRNLGVRTARNDLCVVFDADVIPQPGCIDTLRSEAERGKFVGGVVIYETTPEGRAEFFKTHKGQMAPRFFMVGNYPIEDVLKLLDDPKSDKTGTLGGVMCFSKADWAAVGGFDTAYSGYWGFSDTDFTLKLHFNGVRCGVIKPTRDGKTGQWVGAFGYHQAHPERQHWKLESMQRNRSLLISRLPAYKERRFNGLPNA